ncbi:hypothetical protein OAC95_00870 [Polaribacter sp.]|nr:hypothetical protein [Polaribacter sp.]
MSNTMKKTKLNFNGTYYLFKEDNNNSFKVYVDGELRKSHIHIDYFPSTLLEFSEFLTEYELKN